MLFIIDIAWTRRAPEPGRPDNGTTTYSEYARTLTTAKRRAAAKFRRHYGAHLAIRSATEKQDPAGIFTDHQVCSSTCQ